MEWLVGNDQRAALSGLLVADGGIQVDDDGRPAEPTAQTGSVGHVSPSAVA